MKYLLLFMLLVSVKASGQKDTTKGVFLTGSAMRVGNIVNDSLFTFRAGTGSKLCEPKEQSLMVFRNRVDNDMLLRITPDWKIYYLPSAFCDCRKCRKYKGMKELIYKK